MGLMINPENNWLDGQPQVAMQRYLIVAIFCS